MGKLEFGSAFSRVFDLYGKYAAPLLIWSAAVQVVVAAVIALLTTGVLAGSDGIVAVSFALLFAVAVVGGAILTGAYIVGLDTAERTGTFPSFGETWGRVAPRLGALIVTSILAGLGIALGLVLLLVPGLVLLTWWAVFAPVVMLEDRSGPDALGRSRGLVRGNGWTVFGLTIVVMILTQIAAGIIGAIVGSILGGRDEFVGVFGSQFVTGTITAPISALLAVVIYEALTGRGAGDEVTDPYGTTPEQQAPPAPGTQPGTQPGDGTPGGHSGPFV